MSTAEAPPVPRTATGGGALAGMAARRGVVRPWLRLLRSELGLMFRRWRNRALLAVVVTGSYRRVERVALIAPG